MRITYTAARCGVRCTLAAAGRSLACERGADHDGLHTVHWWAGAARHTFEWSRGTWLHETCTR